MLYQGASRSKFAADYLYYLLIKSMYSIEHHFSISHLIFMMRLSILLLKACNSYCYLPASWMKLFRTSIERALSSTSFADLNICRNRLSRQTRAAPRIPVSGRMPSMCVSHAADTKHAEHKSAHLLFKPSAKASKSRPNSWLTRAYATFLSQSSAAFSSSR